MFDFDSDECFWFAYTGLYLNSKQIDTLRDDHNISEGDEWAPYSGFDKVMESKVKEALAESSLYSLSTQHSLAQKATAGGDRAVVKRDYASITEEFEIPGQSSVITPYSLINMTMLSTFRHVL